MTSAALISALSRRDIDELYLVRMTIEDSRIAEPIRLVNDTQNQTDGSGNAWVGFPFGINMPGDGSTRQSVQATIQNVNQVIGGFVLKAGKSPGIVIETVTRDDPDTVIDTAADLRLSGTEVTDIAVTGAIVSKIDPNDPWPANTADARKYPGLFR